MKKIFFCGGGSAGHVVPNIALMRSLKDSYQLGYLGTDGIEYNLVRAEGIKYYTINAPKLQRGKILANLTLPFRLYSSVKQAKQILLRELPDLVFCKGGYVSLPPALAAKRLKIPVITHESDYTLGLANRIISRFATVTLTSFAETAERLKRGRFSGPPIRADAISQDREEAKSEYGFLGNRPVVLVFGGGSGSLKINAALRGALYRLTKRFDVLHVCGRGNYMQAHIDGYVQIEYAADMGKIYACADYAVARAGSNSAFELMTNKIPTLFIPLENGSTRGDQVKNAEAFSRNGLCHILREKDLDAETLANAIEALAEDAATAHNLALSNIKPGNDKIIFEIEKALVYK